MKRKLIVGASLGNCVHVAGVLHFLDQAEAEGWDAVFLGPAVSPQAIEDCVRETRPDLVALGYRLTPENAVGLVEKLIECHEKCDREPLWLFGATAPVAEKVRALGFFDIVLDGSEEPEDTIAILRGEARPGAARKYAASLGARIAQKRPYPILRHHFGLPDFEKTKEGIARIAEARALDVLSLGIDQNTQQFFFHPERRDSALEGAGGVPVKTEEEFCALREAARAGNMPLMRCYSGTADVLRMAETLLRTIDNAWCATPLFWYGEMDGRGERTLPSCLRDAQALMRYHAARGIPVEANEPHHWALRDAHDTIAVAMAYVSALNAKRMGVKEYVQQFMFNTPPSLSFEMDLAKALAAAELTAELADENFVIFRETRAGLPFFRSDPAVAKGQLAASTFLQLALKPHIVHVVGYSEAVFAATAEVVIESCGIVRGVMRSALEGSPDFAADPRVQSRKEELIGEAKYLLAFIRARFKDLSEDPLTDADCLAGCVKAGILDAPQLRRAGGEGGGVKTRVVGGRCVAWDEAGKRELNERERLGGLDRRSAPAKGGRI